MRKCGLQNSECGVPKSAELLWNKCLGGSSGHTDDCEIIRWIEVVLA
jgi:hypothetical protein